MIFGDWIHQISNYQKRFQNAKPYEHVVINNFFTEEYAKNLVEEFPSPTDKSFDWKHYDNPLEQKYSLNTFSELSTIQATFDTFQSNQFVTFIQQLTGIENLESDPHLHGAGLHAYPANGKLDIHLDYSIHPITGKERRVNLIVYLNPEWKTDYGGELQLWDSSLSSCEQIVAPAWNSAILFRTSDISYHGIPKPIRCPKEMYRKSLAIYYVSEQRENTTKRYKAEYVPFPGQPVSEKLRELYSIRKARWITETDVWEGWRDQGNGYW